MSWERIAAEIEATPELTPDQERALAMSAQAGDARARSGLIAANLRHALPIARALAKHGQRWEPGDLLGEAVRAMDGLVDRWDGRGIFGGYAKARLRGAMKDFLRRRADVLRTPDGVERVLSLDAPQNDDEAPLLERLSPACPVPTGDDEDSTLPAFSPSEQRVLAATVLRRPVPGNVREACQSLGWSEKTVRRVLRNALAKGAATGRA